MAVVHVHGTHVPDLTEGVSRNVDSLVRSLRARGEEARLAAHAQPLESLNRHARLAAGALHARRMAAAALRDPAVRLVHWHVSLPSLAVARHLVARRRPVLVHAWNAALEAEATPRLPGRALHRLANGEAATRLALRGATDVAVSSRHQEAQLEALGIGAQVHRIPNGVDTERFRPASPEARRAARRRYGLGAGPVVLYYGHTSPWKGLDTLAAALPAVLAAHPGAQALLSVTGYGAGRGALEARLRRAGIRDRCVVTGPADVPTLHAAADVAVVPLRAAVGTACHPNVLLESMASGLPVVASAVGSVPEVVRDGSNGLLVPPGDAAALATALTGLLDAPPRRRALGLAARDTMLQRHSWPAAAAAFQRVYRSLGALPAPSPLPAVAEVAA
jgi:glycosyltransferase involved in cell wall biosynthesis